MEASEFNKLTYPEKLKYWLRYIPIGQGNYVYDKEGEVLMHIVPDERNQIEVLLFNEFSIKRYKKLMEDRFKDSPKDSPCKSFEQLKGEFLDLIREARPIVVQDETQKHIERYMGMMNKDNFQHYDSYRLNDLSKVKDIVDSIEFIKLNSIIEFVNFLQDFKDNGYKVSETLQKDWVELHDALIREGYIKNVSRSDFSEVMNYKRLPNGKERISWTGKRYELKYFGDRFQFSFQQNKSCFLPGDGKDLRHNDRGQIKDDFEKLLDRYCDS